MKLLYILLISITSFTGEPLTDIRDVLKEVESNGDPNAIGDGGLSYGILQIQQGAIDDVNERFDTNYKHEDAFDIECAEEIFELYIQRWATHLEKKEGRKATAQDIVRIWNGGPQGYKKQSTIDYYIKYNEEKG